MQKILNASNVLGAIAFMALIAAIAACEGESYIISIALVAVFAGCAHLSIKEDGKRK